MLRVLEVVKIDGEQRTEAGRAPEVIPCARCGAAN